MIGNFIGDYVKGKKYLEYPEPIQQGILLHRAIDSFTDRHPNFRTVKSLLNPTYGLYSGVVTDIFIDHFLAANWQSFHPVRLEEYTQRVYKTMHDYYSYLPDRIKGFFNNLVERNRLLSYAEISGVEEALMIMSFRTSLPGKSNEAMKLLKDQYPLLKQLSIQFIKEIDLYIKNEQVNAVVQNDLHPAGEE